MKKNNIIEKAVQHITKKYNDPVVLTIETTESAAVETLIPLLEELKFHGDIGHSSEIIIDSNDPDYEKKYGFDGDGADRIKDIKMEALVSKEKSKLIKNLETLNKVLYGENSR